MPEQLLTLAIVMTIAFAFFAFTGKLKAYPGRSKWILVSLLFLRGGLLYHYARMLWHK